MSGYELRGVVKRYGAREVLRVEQLSIASGRTTAILGPSGAGKSTLLRLLNFLEPPDAGRLFFEGQSMTATPPLDTRRAVTTVFQRPLLLNTSVWGNITYGLRLRGQAATCRAEAVLEQVGLAHLARARANTLSGGEAQRVALARALVVEPRVLLLDEPTANLDPSNVQLIEAILQRLRATSITLVIVTHNLFQAQRLADDAALLINGELVEHGPLRSLFDTPRDPRTAAFCQGTMVY